MTNAMCSTELADLAGVTPRTVRYYLAQGLLPAVGQGGPGSRYGSDHLARLRLIRRLQGEHLPLAEIRRRLDALDDGQIRELAGGEPPAPPVDSALDYLRSVLQSSRSSASAGPMPAPSVAPAVAPAVVAERLDDPVVSTSWRHRRGHPAGRSSARSGSGSSSRPTSSSTSVVRLRGRRTSRSIAS